MPYAKTNDGATLHYAVHDYTDPWKVPPTIMLLPGHRLRPDALRLPNSRSRKRQKDRQSRGPAWSSLTGHKWSSLGWPSGHSLRARARKLDTTPFLP